MPPHRSRKLFQLERLECLLVGGSVGEYVFYSYLTRTAIEDSLGNRLKSY